MAKACICLGLLLVFPFLALGETVGEKQPCNYPTLESVVSDLGIGECVLDENRDGESGATGCVNSCALRLRSTEGIIEENLFSGTASRPAGPGNWRFSTES